MSENILIERIKDSRKKVHDILDNIDYYNENCIYPDDLVKLEQLLKFLEDVEKYRNKKYSGYEMLLRKYIYKELENYSEIELEGLYEISQLKGSIEELNKRIKDKKLSEEELIKISEVLIYKEEK